MGLTDPDPFYFQLNSIRQKLQKTKDQGSKQRSSPIPANHNALLQTAPAVLMRSSAIGIPLNNNNIPKTSMSRYQRNSVEGLNPVSADTVVVRRGGAFGILLCHTRKGMDVSGVG